MSKTTFGSLAIAYHYSSIIECLWLYLIMFITKIEVKISVLLRGRQCKLCMNVIIIITTIMSIIKDGPATLMIDY